MTKPKTFLYCLKDENGRLDLGTLVEKKMELRYFINWASPDKVWRPRLGNGWTATKVRITEVKR